MNGSICINQPKYVNHVLCYGRMYSEIQEECPNCEEKIKCNKLTNIYHVEAKTKKRKKKEKIESVFIKGVK